MIAFIIYAVLFSALIFYKGFFGLFKDDKISKKQFTFLFALKALAVPGFYFVYKKLYGGIEHLDAGIFYHDAKVLNEVSYESLIEYLKLLFGFQSEQESLHLTANTTNWDNGYVKDFFYNDNRIVIRVHSLLHFIAFNSYFVHALFSCFLSFVGIVFLYKSIKEFFEGKEMFVLLILCFFPALWFYTGALLKEGITFFVLGCTAFQLKQLISKKISLRNFLWLVFLLFVSTLLKPYVLCVSAISFALFFFIRQKKNVKYKFAVFSLVMFAGIIAANFLSQKVKHKSLFEAALIHQRNFSGVANGGIFLASDTTYIRLEYDSTLVNQIAGKPDIFTIKKNVPYTYWENSHHQDTLYCAANQDTVTQYHLVFKVAQAGSNIPLSDYGKNNFTKTFSAFYYALFYPFFFHAKNLMQILASFENLAVLISLIVCLVSLTPTPLQRRGTKEHFPALVFLFIALSVCFIIGLTTPNSGALFRYRSPVIIFILLAGLYYLPVKKISYKRS